MNRKVVITTVAAGLLVAGLPSAVAAAAPGCAQWEFNGNTLIQVHASGHLQFPGTGVSIGYPQSNPDSQVVEGTYIVSGSGLNPPASGFVMGEIGPDGTIGVGFTSDSIGGQFTGHVNPDGSAQGTVFGDGQWTIDKGMLKCMGT